MLITWCMRCRGLQSPSIRISSLKKYQKKKKNQHQTRASIISDGEGETRGREGTYFPKVVSGVDNIYVLPTRYGDPKI